jgi:hypothetical protein
MKFPDPTPLAQSFHQRDDLATVDHFVAPETLARLVDEANALRPRINRNFVPRVKKGGSVNAFDIAEHAPALHAFYRSPELLRWLETVTGETLMVCPDDDPHACALYYYTEAGDHIGWHYDTSFYRGKRFTVLVSLVQQSSCELVCHLYEKDRARAIEELRLSTPPGTLVVFNGDTIHHCVTPSNAGEDRVVFSLEYVTDPTMGTVQRWVSNVKDAVAYFGIRGLFRPKR